ncbi:MAG: hypothetical protein WCK26_01065 [Candidatus Saccharibacteria bacterium]
MFCIAAFIVLAIISIFSARYRKLAKKAWGCTARRVTFRPCDTSFKEETKNKLLSHVAKRTPKLVKVADISIEIASFAFVVLTIWSLLVVFESGLNLFVWGTCNPSDASSCSLSSETCSIDKVNKDLFTLTLEGKPFDWFVNQANTLENTISNIPTRLQKWNAADYLPENATYFNKYDKTKPLALEVIDPGCSVCAHLYKNIKEAGFEKIYNLTYIAYPIKNPAVEGQYKFKNSYIVTSYLESLRINPIDKAKTPADWQILERIFTWKDKDDVSYQIKINSMLDKTQTKKLINTWLIDIGYSAEQIKQIESDTGGTKVANIIKNNQQIVDNKIKTVKIPTIIFDGRRRDGLVSVQDLK